MSTRKASSESSQSRTGRPRPARSWLIIPLPSKNARTTVTTAATGITMGIRKAERKKLAPRNFRYRARASRKERTISSGTPTPMKRKVFPAARRKAALPSRSV